MSVPDDMESLSVVVAKHVDAVLAACRGNKSRAARILGVSRWCLYRRSASIKFGVSK